MYDVLLTLHLLGAAAAFVTVVMFSAWALGAAAPKAHFWIADVAWNVSGALLVVFGVWLALYVDGYELWDGWILGALVLFGATGGFGAQARREAMEPSGEGAAALRRVSVWHWLRTLSVIAILVLMVWKPGA